MLATRATLAWPKSLVRCYGKKPERTFWCTQCFRFKVTKDRKLKGGETMQTVIKRELEQLF